MTHKELADWLLSIHPMQKQACIGLDGFVDRVLRVVDQRLDTSQVTYVRTLADYGQKLIAAAGLSLNVEMIPQMKKYGGNGPLMAGALASMGSAVCCIGSMGYPDVAKEFAPLQQTAAVYSFAEPASTDSYEFEDGKIIASVLDSLNRLDWELAVSRIGSQTLYTLLDQADLIAMNNWTMIPSMSQIWTHLQQEILPELSARRRILFFDLADPSKRTETDLKEALTILQGFTPFGRVVLSCNQREAVRLASVVGINAGMLSLPALCQELQKALRLQCLSIHTLKNAYAFEAGTGFEATGFYTPAPKISIGGGDHFNAGFAFGMMHGLPLSDALTLGSTVSGVYVRSGRSPVREEIASFLAQP